MSFLNLLEFILFISSFFPLHNRYIFWFLLDCCTVNAFTLLKYFQPNTRSTIRQTVFKSFRLELAQGLIGNYNSRLRYALPPALHDAAHKFTSAPAKRRRNECGTTDGTAPTLEGHFPIKGSTGRCCYCWNVKGRRHDSCVRCRRCGKALCIVNWDSLAEGPSCFERYHTERL